MKRPKLPDQKINFERIGRRWARVIGYRPPRKGEYFLGGAVVEAHLAYNDQPSPAWVAEPIPDPIPQPVHLHQYPSR